MKSSPACLPPDRIQSSCPCNRVRLPKLAGCSFRVCASAFFLLLLLSLSERQQADDEGAAVGENVGDQVTAPEVCGCHENAKGQICGERECGAPGRDVSESEKARGCQAGQPSAAGQHAQTLDRVAAIEYLFDCSACNGQDDAKPCG